MISRRDLLTRILRLAPMGCGSLASLGSTFWQSGGNEAYAGDKLEDLVRTSPRARYWMPAVNSKDCASCHPGRVRPEGKLPKDHDKFIKCLLCAQGCILRPGERGGCRARINANGEMRSLVYGRPVSIHVDPIEK